MAKTECKVPEKRQEELHNKVIKYHKNQAPPGRHRCVFCAYEEGYADGYKKAQKDLLRNLFKDA